MEIIFELLIEVVGQLVVEVLFHAGFEGLGRILANPRGRGALGVVLGAGGGFGIGYWVGVRHAGLGRDYLPRSLWISVALAVVFAAFGLMAIARAKKIATGAAAVPTADDTTSVNFKMLRERTLMALSPWRWSAARLLGFAVMNCALAVGMAAGFSSRPLG